MVKRLVCLFDGTWNRPDDAHVTNVVKLQRLVLPADAAGVTQLVHYEMGIATEKSLGGLAFTVGAVGLGVGERIRAGYRFLCESWAEGDEITIIGFSRGAFEARSLAGLVALTGLARASDPDAVEAAWGCYEQNKLAPDPARLQALRATSCYPVPVKCVAVWDTVGNLGIPFLRKGVIRELLGFHDTELSPLVEIGLHALAIDEPRGPFSPTLWTRKAGAAPPAGQRIEQVWFPGCHANVGGGYPDSALSDIALVWMAERLSETAGLALDLQQLRHTTGPDPLGRQVSPTSDGVYRVSRLFPFVRLIKQNRKGISALRRAILGTWRSSELPAHDVPVNESIHPSAIARYGKRVAELRGADVVTVRYRPRPLAATLRAARRGKGRSLD